MMRSALSPSYIVLIGTRICPRASPDGVLNTEPVPSKKRLMERRRRFCMMLTPLGSAPVAIGAVGQVIEHEVPAAQVAARTRRGGRHSTYRYLEETLDAGETVSHGDPLSGKNSHVV
jgi:hypothetical protein